MRTTIARIVLMAVGMAFGVVAGAVVKLPLPAHVGLAIVCAGLLGTIPQRGRKVPVPAAAVKSAAAAAKPETPPPPADPEALMPRWRRPSLQAARRGFKTDTTRPPMTFDARRATYESWEDESNDLAGKEILRVRAAVAPLLDVADEVLGDPLSELIRNDEVAVIETKGAYRFVACPDGRRGWIHRTSLVGGADEPVAADPDSPAAMAGAAGAR